MDSGKAKAESGAEADVNSGKNKKATKAIMAMMNRQARKVK
jgi:hypothetical protein